METVPRLRVLVVDDHEIWRAGLRNELGDGIVVVAEAADADQAIAAVAEHRPDLVLCDLEMPGGGGMAVVRACADEVPIVMLSVSEAERHVLDCVACGAVGYLSKSTTGAELTRALTAAAAGEPVFSPGLAVLVLAELRRMQAAELEARGLSDREREVLILVARGHTYREIGERLHIATKTAENHLRRVLVKLQLTRREEAVRFVVREGLDK